MAEPLEGSSCGEPVEQIPAHKVGAPSSTRAGTSNAEYSRKERSLGLLCERFLEEYGDGKYEEVCLDEALTKLGAQRRRIYDIVNCLESLEIVSRLGKNKYQWHGLRKFYAKVSKLKKEMHHNSAVALLLPEAEPREAHQSQSEAPRTGREEAKEEEEKAVGRNKAKSTAKRKEKALSVLCKSFVQILMAFKGEAVSLDSAAASLAERESGSPKGKSSINAAQIKTKVRRLYDIANILSALRLISRSCDEGLDNRKPAFIWQLQDEEQMGAAFCNAQSPNCGDCGAGGLSLAPLIGATNEVGSSFAGNNIASAGDGKEKKRDAPIDAPTPKRQKRPGTGINPTWSAAGLWGGLLHDPAKDLDFCGGKREWEGNGRDTRADGSTDRCTDERATGLLSPLPIGDDFESMPTASGPSSRPGSAFAPVSVMNLVGNGRNSTPTLAATPRPESVMMEPLDMTNQNDNSKISASMQSIFGGSPMPLAVSPAIPGLPVQQQGTGGGRGEGNCKGSASTLQPTPKRANSNETDLFDKLFTG